MYLLVIIKSLLGFLRQAGFPPFAHISLFYTSLVYKYFECRRGGRFMERPYGMNLQPEAKLTVKIIRYKEWEQKMIPSWVDWGCFWCAPACANTRSMQWCSWSKSFVHEGRGSVSQAIKPAACRSFSLLQRTFTSDFFYPSLDKYWLSQFFKEKHPLRGKYWFPPSISISTK